MSFSASHRVYNPEFNDELNAQIFKKCANKNGHGHNFVLEVTVVGEINPKTGYVIDLKTLKNIIQTEVIDLLDHSNLNFDVKELVSTIPTSENLAVFIWDILKNKIPSAKLHKIKISESETSSIEYFG